MFAQQETVEFAELDEIRAHRTVRQRRSCIARLESPVKGRGQAASGFNSERVLRLAGLDGKTCRRQHHRHRHRDSQRHALLSAQIVIVHQKTVDNPGIDPLQHASLFIQALPFGCGMRQLTKIPKMIRIHFDAHHSGLGTGSDVTKTVTCSSSNYVIPVRYI